MHDPFDRSVREVAIARRRRMVRRQTARRMKVIVVMSAVLLVGVLLVEPTPPVSATSGAATTATSDVATPGDRAAPLVGPRATLFRTLPANAASPWRRPGDLLKRDRAGDAPLFAFGTDLRLTERHESLNRWHRIYSYSAKYRIKPDLARRIYDAAITAGLEPELGFRLVRVESVFDPKAESPVGALGLTQLMPSTARFFEPNVTREQLLTADVNLRIGFKYLRTLIREHKGDLKLALLVYNRGPAAVGRALAMGQDPANGYESIVTKGYRGRGTIR
jgi:soluble lytic murein transglycosylase-like protein